jgi:hypothetical protein
MEGISEEPASRYKPFPPFAGCFIAASKSERSVAQLGKSIQKL